MFPWEFFFPLYQQYSENKFFGICIAFSTLGGWPLGAWSLLGLSGAASPMMSPAGQNTACTVSGARSTATPACCRSPQQRFAHLHIDLVGPLQYSSGCKHIFAIIDRTSKWMEAVPLSEMSAAACARALVFSWITRFGVLGCRKRSLLIMGRNLHPLFGHSFAIYT